MAKVTGPLHSDAASGLIGSRLVFSKRKTGQQVRVQRAQKLIVSTWGQADQKSLYRVAYARWLSFSAAQKKAFDKEAEASNLKISGWNLFLKYAITSPKIYLGLVGYWSMNRAGFGTVLDLSKNGNVGTLKPTWPTNSPKYADSKNKKMLNALSFDGVNDYVDCGTKQKNLAASAATLEMWINASYATMKVAFADGLSKIGLGFYTVGTDKTFIVTCGIDTDKRPLILINDWNNNIWNHVVITYDSSHNPTGYVNALLKSKISTNYWTMNIANLLIGCRYITTYANFFGAGKIDEVRLYDRALGAAEIKNLYNLFK